MLAITTGVAKDSYNRKYQNEPWIILFVKLIVSVGHS